MILLVIKVRTNVVYEVRPYSLRAQGTTPRLVYSNYQLYPHACFEA